MEKDKCAEQIPSLLQPGTEMLAQTEVSGGGGTGENGGSWGKAGLDLKKILPKVPRKWTRVQKQY